MFSPISRRQVIRDGLTALAAGALLPTTLRSAQADTTAYDPPATALTLPPPRGMASVTAQLNGVGVYVGNGWFDWSAPARRFALAKVRAWGFDFICPKVGGYGRTWYQDEAQLRDWADDARSVGLGFIPFLYTVPDTGEADARLAAQMAKTVGIVCVDMEDEWGANEKSGPAGYKGAQMAAFGRVYRQEAGPAPVIVTGYGDPITRFGPANSGFPYAEMAVWADAYSPQWYIGVYSRYHKGGVGAALDWGVAECQQALGADYSICPSIDLECSYTPDSLFPLADTNLLMARMRTYNAPVFVWEYGLMTPAHAEALLGPPMVKNVRVGTSNRDSFSVSWDTHVPARSEFTTLMPGTVAAKTSQGQSLELTHTEGLGKLAPGTACQITVGASSGGGTASALPLTVVTAPAVPGVFAQSAQAAQDAQGQLAVTLMIANSDSTDLADVIVTQLSVPGGTVLSPALPYDLGALAHRDWEASTRDRSELTVIVTGIPPASSTVTVNIAGSASGGASWTSTVPVALAVPVV
jgi:hypothetical protein